MSWDELNNQPKAKEYVAKAKEKAVNIAKAYSRCFETPEGQTVISDLTQKFLMNNDTSIQSTNVNYEAAYHNGESGVVKHLINQIRVAKEL